MDRIGQRIQSIDAFAKPHDDFRTKTFLGGIVTILSVILIGSLVLFEYIDFQRISWRPQLVVDRARREKMTINFDISFPKVPCFAINLDVMDAANQYQNNLSEGISKTRLDSTGKSLDIFQDNQIKRPSGYCGSCYAADAKGPDGKPICCNSCSAVFAAYEHKNLGSPKVDTISQCNEEKWSDLIKKHINEGCRIKGKFKVNKISGNFHFAPGHSYDAYNFHLHDISFLDGLHLDFSHKIHYLSFGEHHPEIINPLDNTENIGRQPELGFKYYAKVVAAEFCYRDGSVLHTNQFAVTQNDTKTHGDKTVFPSIFFNYDISPMVVYYTEYKRTWTSFLIGICAIIGGVYTVAAIFDSIVYHAERQIRRKNLLGKTS